MPEIATRHEHRNIQTGAERWQGGTLRGVRSKLGYLKDLGVNTIWLGPIFKQRGHHNTYHGYGIQDFMVLPILWFFVFALAERKNEKQKR